MASEIPLSGPKAAGVRGINLKDDNVISGICYSEKTNTSTYLLTKNC